jgi:hypothetical protein
LIECFDKGKPIGRWGRKARDLKDVRIVLDVALRTSHIFETARGAEKPRLARILCAFRSGFFILNFIMLRQNRTLASPSKLHLKPVSRALLIAETLDLMTTFGGFVFFPHMWEANPLPGILGGWAPTIALKIAGTILVIMILEKVEKWPRTVWIVPLAAFIPVAWNLTSILAEVIISFVI